MKLTIKDFEAMAMKNGLVAMQVTRSFAPYFKGSVNGFPPAQALKLYEDGDAVPHKRDVPPKAAAKAEAPIEPPRSELIEIPANWREEHHFTRRKLASQISGKPSKDFESQDEADGIIEAEVNRRAGNDETL